MRNRFGWLRKGQRGFTLLELLVAIPIAALVVAAASAGLIQLLNSGDASTHMYALRQVQTAGHWVSADGVQADTVVHPELAVTDNTANTARVDLTAPGHLLTFRWGDQDPDVYENYEVQYHLVGAEGNLMLERREKVWDYGILDPDPDPSVIKRQSTTVVGRYITQTSFWYTSDNPEIVVFEVTATIGADTRDEQTETRKYEIRPRSREV